MFRLKFTDLYGGVHHIVDLIGIVDWSAHVDQLASALTCLAQDRFTARLLRELIGRYFLLVSVAAPVAAYDIVSVYAYDDASRPLNAKTSEF